MRLSGIRMLTIFVGIAVALASRNAEAKTIYVKAGATGSPDGTSWSRAYGDLQDALDDAASTPGHDEIWVAKGTYVPSRIYSPNDIPGGACSTKPAPPPAVPCDPNDVGLKTFDLPDLVAIYGGFAGSEKSRGRRSPAEHPTVLDGGGTSWHVVTAGNDTAQTGVRATLDGLTITGGNAVGPGGNNLLFAPFDYGHNLGGGLYVAFDSVIDVNNVHFHGNNAGTPFSFSGDGGGLFSINSTLTVTGSRFTDNTADLRGGALEVLNTFEGGRHHDARIVGSTFEGNRARIFGGAIVGEGTVPNAQSSLLIDDCTFEGNRSEFEGGAIVFDSLKTTVRNSRFNNNSAKVAAGALATTNVVDTFVYATLFSPTYSFPKFETTVVNCVFNDNIAEGDTGDSLFGVDFARGGGALVAYLNGYLNVVNSTFKGNVARNGMGGAILNGNAEAKNVFGTGVDVFDVETRVVNSTFIGNMAMNVDDPPPLPGDPDPDEWDGHGGAIASMPGPLSLGTETNRRLSIISSRFTGNTASTNGGGIFLSDSTATVLGNGYTANTPNHVYGIDSIINNDPYVTYVR